MNSMLILCNTNGHQMNMSGGKIQDEGIFLKTALRLLEKNSGTCFFISLIAFSVNSPRLSTFNYLG